MSCFSRVSGKTPVLSSLRKDARLTLELAKRDLTERYSGATLGAIWNFIYPLVSIVIYVVIFSSIMGARLPGSSSVYSYSIYLVAGIIPWTAFANTISRMSSVYLDKNTSLQRYTSICGRFQPSSWYPRQSPSRPPWLYSLDFSWWRAPRSPTLLHFFL